MIFEGDIYTVIAKLRNGDKLYYNNNLYDMPSGTFPDNWVEVAILTADRVVFADPTVRVPICEIWEKSQWRLVPMTAE